MINTYKENKDDLLVAIERFELVAKATHDVIWDWDLVNGTVWWNKGMESIFGYASEEIKSGPDSWYERIHPDDQDRVIRNIHTVIDNGENNWSDYYRFKRSDGSYANVHDRGYTIKVDDRPVRMVGSMRDLTEQLKTEKAHRESEENLTFALEAAQLGIWNTDPVKQTIAFDDRCKQLYGNPKEEELTFENLMQHIHYEDRERVKAAVANALNPDLRNLYDIRYRTVGATDKILRWLHCRGQAYFTTDGTPYRFSGVSRDITYEISNQEKVTWADQQAAMTIEGSGAGSFLINADSNVIIHSPTMARIITGREELNITREMFINHVHPDDLQTRLDAYSIAEKTGDLKYEARFVWIDGSIHWIRVIGKYLFDSSGNTKTISGIVMDITDRIESEQKLRKSEEKYRQLASELERRVQQRTEELYQTNLELINSNNNLQQFAYAASHDMQEPLRKIQSFGSRLSAVYSKELDENGAFMLSRIQDASKRMSAMIDDLLAFSRLSTHDGNFQPVGLNQVVKDVLADLEISIQEQKSNITVEPLPAVWGISSQLTQLFQNLLSNAIKYRKPEIPSEINISFRVVDENEKSRIPKLLDDQSYICVEVSDNGIGFEETYLDRIFQMFQRLHGRSEFAGSGIGLALCKKVVQNHHGYITARSTPGEGSTFMVYLPVPKD
ncbi:PAS domain-containing protein [Dyadobacter sp. CY323]|uniref:PAS domain-containing sensor histidine kinase n=1 Tax=Dyadobacter sp. CY323 TaxID=2907302 RepID=UPI001F441E0B|nr:PAS domain-containing protein [Dyadobacter sp. CY323]MCE6987759.1 PAS domain-containing protein [Dyadobacter sp. CY323]